MSKKHARIVDQAQSSGRSRPDPARSDRRQGQSFRKPNPFIALLVHRTSRTVLSLVLVAALQLSMTWDKLSSPFLDTQLHYSFDNALFSTYARNGNRLGDLRSQFGITSVPYAAWGEKSGPSHYYTHHPFLFKALLQQYSKILGNAEWVSRSFYLLLSFGIASGFYTVLMVFVPIVSHPFSEWFQGPLFEYYTDRPVVAFDGKDSPKPGDKILLLRYTQQAEIVPQVEEHFGVRLSGEKCSSRICAYDAQNK